jgi:broad specificity phosphatase PhoE
MKELELRRHAFRDSEGDRLSPEGRLQAEDVGRTLPSDYSVIFVSPAQRAAETVAWFLRGSGQQLPSHAQVPDLLSPEEDRWRAAGKAARSSRVDDIARQDPDLLDRASRHLAHVVEGLFDRVPEGGRGLVVGHTPLLEAAVFGLTGTTVDPLAECEGILLTREDDGRLRVDDLRR